MTSNELPRAGCRASCHQVHRLGEKTRMPVTDYLAARLLDAKGPY